jgi:NTP pyrophosphatase (non-canonical NTP hydrolase)
MEWHDTYGVPVGDHPYMLDKDREQFRFSLIEEEYIELQEALEAHDIIETADALGDMIYVIYGFAIEMGINLGAVMTEIQRSNMSKLGLDGLPVLREDGKILKGPNFSEPNLYDVIYG